MNKLRTLFGAGILSLASLIGLDQFNTKFVGDYAIIERPTYNIISQINSYGYLVDEGKDGSIDKKYYSISGAPWGAGIGGIVEQKVTEEDQKLYQSLLSKLWG